MVRCQYIPAEQGGEQQHGDEWSGADQQHHLLQQDCRLQEVQHRRLQPPPRRYNNTDRTGRSRDNLEEVYPYFLGGRAGNH
uniref:Uncharacterized protein n=1 Tax=Timema poppense TaxID=170557 RepID=A0A7R9HCR6_TIMPO|nr:unnamed protein product [Timema poppensis]